MVPLTDKSPLPLAEDFKSQCLTTSSSFFCFFFFPLLRVTHLRTKAIKSKQWASLVAQWWRTRLSTQETQVQSPVWEDPTCCGATMCMCHNYWACALEPGSCNYWAHVPQLLKATHPWARALQQEKPQQWEACALLERSPCSQQLEKSLCINEDLAQTINE